MPRRELWWASPFPVNGRLLAHSPGTRASPLCARGGRGLVVSTAEGRKVRLEHKKSLAEFSCAWGESPVSLGSKLSCTSAPPFRLLFVSTSFVVAIFHDRRTGACSQKPPPSRRPRFLENSVLDHSGTWMQDGTSPYLSPVCREVANSGVLGVDSGSRGSALFPGSQFFRPPARKRSLKRPN
jgi:hypothetical protein